MLRVIGTISLGFIGGILIITFAFAIPYNIKELWGMWWFVPPLALIYTLSAKRLESKTTSRTDDTQN